MELVVVYYSQEAALHPRFYQLIMVLHLVCCLLCRLRRGRCGHHSSTLLGPTFERHSTALVNGDWLSLLVWAFKPPHLLEHRLAYNHLRYTHFASNYFRRKPVFGRHSWATAGGGVTQLPRTASFSIQVLRPRVPSSTSCPPLASSCSRYFQHGSFS